MCRGWGTRGGSCTRFPVRMARRDSLASVRLELSAGRASGRLVAELEDVSISLGGKLVRGAHGYGSEPGPIIVNPGGSRHTSGSPGCLEQYASGPAIPGQIPGQLEGNAGLLGETERRRVRGIGHRDDAVRLGRLLVRVDHHRDPLAHRVQAPVLQLEALAALPHLLPEVVERLAGRLLGAKSVAHLGTIAASPVNLRSTLLEHIGREVVLAQRGVDVVEAGFDEKAWFKILSGSLQMERAIREAEEVAGRVRGGLAPEP
mgnify:CR=1 FL=1